MNLIQSYNPCINASINSDTSELIETALQRSYDCIKVINTLRSQRVKLNSHRVWLVTFLSSRQNCDSISQSADLNKFLYFSFNTKWFRSRLAFLSQRLTMLKQQYTANGIYLIFHLSNAKYGQFQAVLPYFTEMRRAADLRPSQSIQTNFQERLLIYKAQSWFKAVMYYKNFLNATIIPNIFQFSCPGTFVLQIQPLSG